MKLAGRVFRWSGIYGLAALLPMWFLEEAIGRNFPPATNHPEQYYGFVGVGLAWQLAFLVIARDPVRYRPLMVPAMAEKFVAGGAAVGLFAAGRIHAAMLAPFVVDLGLGLLFLASYLRTSPHRLPEGMAWSAHGDRP